MRRHDVWKLIQVIVRVIIKRVGLGDGTPDSPAWIRRSAVLGVVFFLIPIAALQWLKHPDGGVRVARDSSVHMILTPGVENRIQKKQGCSSTFVETKPSELTHGNSHFNPKFGLPFYHLEACLLPRSIWIRSDAPGLLITCDKTWA